MFRPSLAKLAYKDVAHRLYEYEIEFVKNYPRRLQALASQIGAPEIDASVLANLRQGIQPVLDLVRSFKRIRNAAGGHLDSNIDVYLSVVDEIRFGEVDDAANALIDFSRSVLGLLAHVIEVRTKEIQQQRGGKSQKDGVAP